MLSIDHPHMLIAMRFISYNEHLRLQERRLHFNLNELCAIVAKAVGLP